MLWTIAVGFDEEATDWRLNLGSAGSNAKTYRVNILSVDEVAGRAHASVQLILNRYAFVSNPKVKGPYDGLFNLSDLNLRVGPVTTTDLGPVFDVMGQVALSLLPAYPIQTNPTPEYRNDPPPASQEEFVVS
jgi:hypothetical protein